MASRMAGGLSDWKSLGKGRRGAPKTAKTSMPTLKSVAQTSDHLKAVMCIGQGGALQKSDLELYSEVWIPKSRSRNEEIKVVSLSS